jgi:hypothetical protein
MVICVLWRRDGVRDEVLNETLFRSLAHGRFMLEAGGSI